jgi:xanthine/CO dehydrogenase XdhC/CoxF family maturation factor
MLEIALAEGRLSPVLEEIAMSFPPREIDVLAQAAEWLAQGHKVAIATVVRASGSAPRRPGSHIAVRDDRVFAGSVSAGCVEGAIIEGAQEAIADGRRRTLTFGVSDDGAYEVGLLCGGEIDVLIEPII